MQRRTPVYIIAAPRPRVGKTLLARALTEFYSVAGRNVAAFDVNPDEFALVEHLPAVTAVATIGDIKGQMALFDQLIVPDEVAKIVDLGHSVFDPFFSVLHDIELVHEAQRRGVAPVVLFIADPDRRTRQGYLMLQSRFPDLPLVPVLNEAVPHVARYRDSFPPPLNGAGPILMPAITPVLRSVIDRTNFSFAEYAISATDPTAELFAWTRTMFLIFRELEIRLLRDELRPHLQFPV